MDSDRHHRTGSTGGTSSSELFICFTSRLSSSSSSMKIPSKSILSPGRGRDPPNSLSTSLSRRLRTNGSIKGGQASPMFPTGGKKRGCAFENPEPSSPKVTCIGQVRVKSKKKQCKNLQTHSRRHSSGEVSLRKLEQVRDGVSQSSQTLNQNLAPNNQEGNTSNQECLPAGQRNNQRWVHLPLTICEALRAFGSEFSCLFPCRASCFSTNEREKEEKAVVGSSHEGADNGQSSCGAVFARWLVALQDGEGGRGGREIELMVGRDEERTEFAESPVRNSRRHVFDDLEIVNDRIALKDDEEEARVSICIPPKNALLLMRCRSDPVKMETLASRFWEPTVCKNDDADEEERVIDVKESGGDLEVEEKKEEKILVLVEVNEKQESVEAEMNSEMEVRESSQEGTQKGCLEINEEEEETQVNQTVIEDEIMFLGSLFEEIEDGDVQDPAMEDGEKEVAEEKEAALELEEEELAAEKCRSLGDAEEIVTGERSEPLEETREEEEEGECTETEKREKVSESRAELERESELQVKENEEEREKESSRMLPDCLLLMMCEPKLSMEVSKETWVCSTDFIRWPAEKKKQPAVKPIDGGDESNKEFSIDSNSKSNPAPMAHHKPLLHQPPRSSCSFPAAAPAASMATLIEQKLVNAMGCEPFVLTRCKSEPMRTAAAKLIPETCFWKNRKLEPLRRATFGIGTAGVGF